MDVPPFAGGLGPAKPVKQIINLPGPSRPHPNNIKYLFYGRVLGNYYKRIFRFCAVLYRRMFGSPRRAPAKKKKTSGKAIRNFIYFFFFITSRYKH